MTTEQRLPFKDCPSCGEGVYTYTVQKEGSIEIRCSACGFPLSVDSGPPPQALDCIMIADDDRFFLTLLSDLLTERGLATNVIACESGTKFLSLAADRFHQGVPLKLAILDIIMQPLDGIATAVALRALEKGLKVAQPTPVLFLSAARSDDTLRLLIGRCQPALYLNKGSHGTPGELGPRLEKIIGYLLEQQRSSAHGEDVRSPR
ncbi:MAG: response regulator [candidate division NC10 bacterium]|nr:response regulator [candidate division NC10 bacterium]